MKLFYQGGGLVLAKLLNNFNYGAVITGLFISLLLTIILKFFMGKAALFLLPLMASFICVFLANEIEYIKGITTGLLAGLISIIWIGPYFLILGPLGGFLGVLLNQYLNQGAVLNPVLGKNTTEDRMKLFTNWVDNLRINKKFLAILTILLGIFLIWGVFAGPTMVSEAHPKASPTNNTTQVNPEDIALKNNVTHGLEIFFSNFNTLFQQNGVTTGYIIKSINIVSLNKTSDSEVMVTVNLTRISIMEASLILCGADHFIWLMVPGWKLVNLSRYILIIQLQAKIPFKFTLFSFIFQNKFIYVSVLILHSFYNLIIVIISSLILPIH